MINFFHQLLNPHCEHCREEREINEERARKRAEDPLINILTLELEKAQKEKAQLLAVILNKNNEPEITEETREFKPIGPKNQNFNLIRQKLEADSRKRAEELRKAKEEELEKEVLGANS